MISTLASGRPAARPRPCCRATDGSPPWPTPTPIRDFAPARTRPRSRISGPRVFGHPRGGQTLEWLFRPGPAGASPRAVAEADGRIVAHAGARRCASALGDAVVRGGYSVAAMTDPALSRTAALLPRRRAPVPAHGGAGLRVRGGLLERQLVPADDGAAAAHRGAPISVVRAAARAVAARARTARARRPGAGDRRTRKRSHAACGARRRRDARSRAMNPETRGSTTSGIARRAGRRGRRGARCRLRRLALRHAARRRLPARRSRRAAAAPRDGSRTGASSLRGIPAGFLVDFVLARTRTRGGGVAARRRGIGACRRRGAALRAAARQRPGARRAAARGVPSGPEALHPQVIRFSVRGLGRRAQQPRAAARAWQLGWSDTDVV